MSNKTSHPQAELLTAIAEGKELQLFTGARQWIDCDGNTALAYVNMYVNANAVKLCVRIKPELEPDVVKFANIYKDCVGFFHRTLDEANREADPQSIGVLKITINGETGKVSAEVV